MGFRFRYKALLSYRQHLKEKAEIELSLAQRQLKQAQKSLENYKESLKQENKHLESSLKDKISSHELKNHSDYVAGLESKIGAQELEIAEREKIVRIKMEDLLTKTKQHKAVERLKEKDFQKWNYQQYLIEQKRMNEVAIIRHGKEFL